MIKIPEDQKRTDEETQRELGKALKDARRKS